EGLVGERPVVLSRPGVDREVGGAIAQVPEAQLVEQPEVVLPALVVVAFRHLVLADRLALPLDGGIAVLDPRGEEETGHPPLPSFRECPAVRRRPPAGCR